MPSPRSHHAPSAGDSHLLPIVRVAFVLAWCANVVLFSAAWLQAYTAGDMSKLLGPTALLGWILLIGWLGWRWQARRRLR